MKQNISRAFLPLLLAATALLSCAMFWALWRYDNKYTRPRPPSSMGVTRVEPRWFEQNPSFYLADGWSVYRDKLLTPTEISAHVPDLYAYIGQYGGFDFGNPKANPHGRATYRTVLVTDGTEREYAVELTRIFSKWRMWVNGVPVQCSGYGPGQDFSPGNRMAVFRAGGTIEIVLAVEDETGFYSGMVYPPAFGAPMEVDRHGSLQLLVHGAFCAVAVLTGVLCLLARRANKTTMPYYALALLCFCVCASTMWPLFQMLGLRAAFWPRLEQLGYYGIFISLAWIQYRVCGLPRVLVVPPCAGGVAACVGILVGPLFSPGSAKWLMMWSALLSAYQWFTALWLVGTSAWAVRLQKRYSYAFLAGSTIFACALIMGRMLPLYEPVVGGWFVEVAGGILILLTGIVLRCETVRVYAESNELRARQKQNELQLMVREEHARLAQDYIHRTQKQLHESRNRLTLIRHYLESGNMERLRAYLDELLPTLGAQAAPEYTGHSLVDAILCVELARAQELGIYVERDLSRLPARLFLSDDELTSLLMNLLENAIEGCRRAGTAQELWIFLEITYTPQEFSMVCQNYAPPPDDGAPATSKEDTLSHGYGLSIVRDIAKHYGGNFSVCHLQESFSAELTLPIPESVQQAGSSAGAAGYAPF